MKKLLLAVLTALAMTAPALADNFEERYPDTLVQDCSFTPGKHDKCLSLAQAATTLPSVATTDIKTSAPSTTTTVVKGSDLVSQFIQWFTLAFGTALAGALVALIMKIMGYFGVQTTQIMRDQLQSIVVNGLNDAASKAEAAAKANPRLDVDVKSQIVADAVKYTQDHAPETIRALGLDPKSGAAVKVITARIETALNDPATPTPALITPASGMPSSAAVVIHNATGA